MRKFRAVFMRGGANKGLFSHRDDLPQDKSQWDDIFLQAMESPNPSQIDGVGGTMF